MKNNDELKQTIISKCDALKKELLSKIEPEFELNRWYDSERNNAFFIKSVDKEHAFGYGFLNGKWVDSTNINLWYIKNLLTPSEVETALINEAIKRGFVEGAMFKCLEQGVIRHYRPYYKTQWNKGIELSLRYLEDGDCLFCYGGLWNGDSEVCSNPSIYRAGKWATIIPQEKTSEEWANIYGYTQGISLLAFLRDNNLKIVKQCN